MLDAYIIDRIRRKHEKDRPHPVLRIPIPDPPEPRPSEKEDKGTDGSVIVDYRLDSGVGFMIQAPAG